MALLSDLTSFSVPAISLANILVVALAPVLIPLPVSFSQLKDVLQKDYVSLIFRRIGFLLFRFRAQLTSPIPCSLQRVLHSILSIRVMLHIREVRADNTMTEGACISLPTFAGLEYREPRNLDEEWELGQPRASTPPISISHDSRG
jgi:hypothetical protein